MSIRYFIAQYIDDPFRKEPRNIGIIGFNEQASFAKFFAEKKPGRVDRRLAKAKLNGVDAYEQWIGFWRGELAQPSEDAIASLLEHGRINFEVIEGGEVTDYGNDSVKTVISGLYDLLVSDAEGEERGDNIHREFISEIRSEFRSHGILVLGNTRQFVPSPVVEKSPIRGERTQHKPSFVQMSKELCVMETMHCASPHSIANLRIRAGYAANMFRDIKNGRHDREVSAVTIANIDPDLMEEDEVKWAIEDAQFESAIVHWRDESERSSFVQSRVAAAGHSRL